MKLSDSELDVILDKALLVMNEPYDLKGSYRKTDIFLPHARSVGLKRIIGSGTFSIRQAQVSKYVEHVIGELGMQAPTLYTILRCRICWKRDSHEAN